MYVHRAARIAFTFVVVFAMFAGPAWAQINGGGASGRGGNSRGTVPALATERVANGLIRPVYVTHAPGDPDRVYILEQHVGRIRILELDTNNLIPTPFLTISGLNTGNEQGLLGLAFHPDYETNGWFYVNYTTGTGGNRTRLVRYTRSAVNPNLADPASATQVLTFTQPFSNHNGGWIDFGPDGYLYIGTGDGGSANDPGNRAQDITIQLLGKMLRIDVDNDDFPADPDANYAIPTDNPFVGVTGDDEIWAYGLRNPWRNSFDRSTGDLYIGDVGQGAWEEVDVQEASSTGGENYGWRCMEGNACTGLTGCTCFDTDLTDPVHEFSHGGSPFRCSITGGYVYRGTAIPYLQGHYFFADYCSDQIWTFVYFHGAVSELQDRTADLAPGGGLSIIEISSFGEDAYGELYICDMAGGEVFKIVPENPIVCVEDVAPPPGVEQQDLNAVLNRWGDADCLPGGVAFPCPEDMAAPGGVEQQDLNAVLNRWGDPTCN